MLMNGSSNEWVNFIRKEVEEASAHNLLDVMGVPRDGFSVVERIEWIIEWCPKEWVMLNNAIQEVVHG